MTAYLNKRANLVRFFTARTSSQAEAEDIVQEIYLKVTTAGPAQLENATAYLYRLGTNVMLDRVRARRRTITRDDAYHQTVNTGPHADAADIPDPDAAMDARRRLEGVMRTVDALPPQCRRVFLMHKIEGLSYAEVAERLGVSRSAVEKHMIAALKRLAEHKS